MDCTRLASDCTSAATPEVMPPTTDPTPPNSPLEYCAIACWTTATASFGVQSAFQMPKPLAPGTPSCAV
ncbi:hypothetical protein FZI93_31535 [Mycobacterium sp. CBMA361]|nr:hypothetical protein [Mycolicibacterium sp. CBMA 361]